MATKQSAPVTSEVDPAPSVAAAESYRVMMRVPAEAMNCLLLPGSWHTISARLYEQVKDKVEQVVPLT